MRYMPHTALEREEMLAEIGVGSIDDLFADIPEEARLGDLLDLPLHESEMNVEKNFRTLAAKNLSPYSAPCFLGAGAYQHHVPSVADHVIQRSEFLTSYTPYQPEISQGTLQALFEFQTQVALITGMEVANASMYDGATSCAEAVLMACRVTRRKKAVISGNLHPHYRDVTRTTLQFTEFETEDLSPMLEGDEDFDTRITPDVACVVVQTPDFFGRLKDYTALAEKCHEAGALLVVVVNEVVSLGAVKSPGEMGADIVAGEGQSIGVPLSYGGPYVGLLATRQKYVRQMPGRLCGQTVDQNGQRGFVLTLSTREQHIRREKATSNICTNAGLCSLAFTIHMSLLGETGFAKLAALNHSQAVTLAEMLEKIDGISIVNDSFFNEFTLRLPANAAMIVEKLASKGILAGVPVSRLMPDNPDMANLLLVAATETCSDSDMNAFVTALAEVL
ncbi:aminomethyl-transferring glycine dehydrogenase subunit GcvPA [Sneathiella chungangensis]|uniref:Probable glycine dehydrogenase (decarboxylating) subunit 1 n=1 Tax=Sneathiella chungangensis TaxID=1418234 RepID=A0A845MHF8_9PROT|nr:aminomethyl-transferring glycine dehydrogenase subunit GcvPA [Sneathiella chungangensis]MZR23473.1 aminomethyl-transferring glycine dehydrogenase subunit GcvPA [Sneathiella chungangensis]